MSKTKQPKQFDIFWVNLDPTIGREMKKTRPCVIVSPDELNDNLGTVLVAPLTHTIRDWPFRVTFTHKRERASIACDHIRGVSKNRLIKFDGVLTKPVQKQLLSVLQELFS